MRFIRINYTRLKIFDKIRNEEMTIRIKNKIYLSFFLLVLLFVINGIFSIITLNHNKKLAEHISAITDPSLEAVESFQDLLVESKMYTTNWVFLRSSQEDKNSLIKLQNDDYPKLKQRLNQLSSKWDSKFSADSLTEIYTSFEQLLVHERKIMSLLQKFEDYDDPVAKLESERILEDEVLPRTSALMNILSKIEAGGRNVRAKKNDELEHSSMLLRTLITVIAITIIGIGTFLSFYMTEIIIRPINKIKLIVNDLGKGIIQKVNYTETKDEIGEMVRSVNNLSENLQRTTAFAYEVGNRNFDASFQPLGEKDTLGKALIAMRDNLKASERELLDANSEIQTIYNASLDAVVIIDEEEKIVKWDKKAETLFGWIAEEVMGKALSSYIVPHRYREAHSRGMKHFLKTGEGPALCKTLDVRALRKNGEEFDISLSVFPTMLKGKYRFIGFVRDITSRKKAEQALAKSEANLRNILENTDTAYLLLDKEANILSYNTVAKELAQKMLDITLVEGKNYFSIIPEGRRNNVREMVLKVLEGKKQVNYETSYSRLNMPAIWLYVNMHPILDKDKNLLGLSIGATDISERKLADEKIRTSEAHLQTSQKIAHIGSWEVEIVSLDPEVLEKNPRINKLSLSDETYRIFGLEPQSEQANRELFYSFLYPEDQSVFQTAFRNAVINGTEFNLEHRIRLRNGKERIVHDRGNVIQDPQKGTKIIGTVQDITERKLAEQQIKESNELYELVSKATNDAIWDWNIVTGEVFWGGGYDKLFGHKPSGNKVVETLSTWVKKIHPEDKEKIVSGIFKALESNDTDYWEDEYRYIKCNGEIAYVQDRGHIIYNKNGKPVRMVGAMRDITAMKIASIEREKITADLIQRNKDLEQFTYIVSHNLRAPVANIIGLSGMLADEDVDNDMKKEIIAGLNASSEKLDSVITDLNHVLQLRNGLVENKIPVYFADVVNDIFTSISSLIERECAQIKFDFSEADKITTVKSYLYSIFYNLITNSIKYRQPTLNPVIKIRSYKCENKIVITFCDNGMGINLSTKREQIFGLYKRFHTHIEGKGLGLFMTKTQVEALGGRIGITSEVNKGTTFKIEFDI